MIPVDQKQIADWLCLIAYCFIAVLVHQSHSEWSQHWSSSLKQQFQRNETANSLHGDNNSVHPQSPNTVFPSVTGALQSEQEAVIK